MNSGLGEWNLGCRFLRILSALLLVGLEQVDDIDVNPIFYRRPRGLVRLDRDVSGLTTAVDPGLVGRRLIRLEGTLLRIHESGRGDCLFVRIACWVLNYKLLQGLRAVVVLNGGRLLLWRGVESGLLVVHPVGGARLGDGAGRG